MKPKNTYRSPTADFDWVSLYGMAAIYFWRVATIVLPLFTLWLALPERWYGGGHFWIAVVLLFWSLHPMLMYGTDVIKGLRECRLDKGRQAHLVIASGIFLCVFLGWLGLLFILIASAWLKLIPNEPRQIRRISSVGANQIYSEPIRKDCRYFAQHPLSIDPRNPWSTDWG
jgi:hypothetical protein